jgi:hypothetical protein
MPVHYLISDDGRFVVERWSGQIAHLEALEHERTLLGDPRLQSGARALSDTRLALFPETNEGNMQELVALHGAAGKHGSISRSAICTVLVDTYDQAKIYRRACAAVGVEVELFTEIEPACAWLEVEPGRALQLLESLKANVGG